MTGAHDWTIYVGVVLGVLGFFLSLLNYVNSRAAIKRDIRVEGAQLHQAAGALKGLLDKAHQSRSTVMSAAGSLQSGNMQRFADQYVTDTVEAGRLEREVAAIDKRLNWVRFGKLSDRLTLIRQLANEIGQIRERCHGTLADDDRQLDQIRADQRAEMAAKLSRGGAWGRRITTQNPRNDR